MGLFDDLIPENGQQKQSTGLFDDLIPGSVASDIEFEKHQFAKQQYHDSLRPPPGKPAGFMANFKASMVDDPATKQNIYADAINVPRENMGMLDGDMVYLDPNDDALKRTGGIGVGGKTAQALSYTPEIVGGVAGAMTANPLIGSTVGSVAGKAYKQLGANLFLDEPQSVASNVGGLATEGTLNLVTGGVGKLATKYYNRKAVSDIEGFDKNTVSQKINDIKKKTGITLDVAQASGLNTLRGIRKWVSKYPGEAASIMQAQKEVQDGQVNTAINRVMDTLSKQVNTTHLGERGINAATVAIETAKKKRDDIAAPLYREAFEDGAQVNTFPVREFLESQINVAKDKHKTVLKRVLRTLDDDISIEGMHYAKLAMDSMLENEPAHVIDNIARRDIARTKDLLLKEMETASPKYKEAMDAFADASERLVNPIEDSVVGVIAKIPHTKAAQAASQLFAKENADPNQIRYAKRIIQREDPQAWRDLTRLFIAKETQKAFKVSEQGEVLNMAGKFNKAVAGTKNQEAAIRAALDPDTSTLFFDVVEAFKDIAASPIYGSDTAMNQLMTDQMRGSATSKLLSPRKSIMDSVDRKFMDKHAKTIAEALTDPVKIKQLKELRKLDLSDEQNVILVSTILGKAGFRELMGPQDKEPESFSASVRAGE